MGCKGLHCPGCGDHGGGELVALVVVLAIIGAAAYHVRRGIETGVEIVALVLVSAAGLAVAAGGVYIAVRIRARVLEARARRTIPAPARVIRLGEQRPASATATPERPTLPSRTEAGLRARFEAEWDRYMEPGKHQ